MEGGALTRIDDGRALPLEEATKLHKTNRLLRTITASFSFPKDLDTLSPWYLPAPPSVLHAQRALCSRRELRPPSHNAGLLSRGQQAWEGSER